MNQLELTIIIPILIISFTAIIVILQTAIIKKNGLTFIITLLGITFSMLSLWFSYKHSPVIIQNLFVVNNFTIFFMVLVLFLSFFTSILSFHFFRKSIENTGEFYVSLLLSILGAQILISSTHFVSLFLGFEIMTVSLYILIPYLRTNRFSVEAGMKYLILASISSVFLLMGMALIYFSLGSMSLYDFSIILKSRPAEFSLNIFIAGTAFFLIGSGFKLSFVPFHMWTPDIYEGSPAPVSAFISTVPKCATLAILFRFINSIQENDLSFMTLPLLIISTFSMFVGNLGAIGQNNIKRLLAYSTIANFGYLIIALSARGILGIETIYFYSTIYFVGIFVAFGILSLISNSEMEISEIYLFRGLFWKYPWISCVFILSLLSLAGLPLTAGFIGKLYVLKTGIKTSQWILVIFLLINSIISAAYYLRVSYQFFETSKDNSVILINSIPLTGKMILIFLTITLLVIGIYPSLFLDFITKYFIFGYF